MKQLENQDLNKVTARIFQDSNLVVVYCSNYLKFGWLKEKEEKTDIYDLYIEKKEEEDDGIDLDNLHVNDLRPDLNGIFQFGEEEEKESMQKINLILTEDTEITEIVETDIPDVLQIVARSYKNKIYHVITWDFKNNVEVKTF